MASPTTPLIESAGRKSFPQGIDFSFLLPALLIPRKRLRDGVQHVLVAKGLGKEIDCAGLHAAHRHRDIAMSGHQNHRQADASACELVLEIEPAHSGQANVEHQTAWAVLARRAEKLCRRAVKTRRQPLRPKEAVQRGAQGFVVVDDMESRFSAHGAGAAPSELRSCLHQSAIAA
jgi:hypothetical protein